MATTLVKPPNSTYTFSSQPKAVQRQQDERQKFREPPANPAYETNAFEALRFHGTVVYPSDESNTIGNLMFDRRVIRGNTYALHTLPAVSSSTHAKNRWLLCYTACCRSVK